MCLPKGLEGLSEGSEGLPDGPKGLPEGLEGLAGGPGGGERMDVWMYRRADGETDRIAPRSTGLCPLLGPLPKKLVWS